MKLIVGLGNPGKEYEKTRHNIGFMVIDSYLKEVKWQEKFQALYYKTIINNELTFFIKPQTFMNLSGKSVAEYVKYFNIEIDDILVIQDDLDQDFGKYKLKKNSSSGGHNGIKSIINCLGTDSFLRLKIGIKNEQKDNVIDFVLGRFSKEELNIFLKMSPIFNEIIDSFLTKGIDKTINIYNSK